MRLARLLVGVLLVAFLGMHQSYAVTSEDEQIKEVKQAVKTIKAKSNNTTKTITATVAPIKKGAPKEQQDLVDYAWSISNNIDFILTIERESGFRWDAVGDGGGAYGLCQRNPHNMGANRWKTSTDPALANGYTMLDKCRESWQAKGNSVGSWLHAYPVRHTVLDRFIIN